jgi:pimeloyl-ACP methyl ester carboxylesterase
MATEAEPLAVQVEGAGADFDERFVELDGFRIRYFERGTGETIVCLHGASGPRLTATHDLLAETYRVVLFELPGWGDSPVNTRSQTVGELALTMLQAIRALGIERYHLWGHSFGSRVACWLAVQDSEGLESLVLFAPAAILPDGWITPTAPAEQRASLVYAHPERRQPVRIISAALHAKQREILGRLRRPGRDPDLEARLAAMTVPTLVLFGTEDRVIPPEMGRLYREILPSCHFVLVYDGGHDMDAERPEAIVSLVADFLERHEQFVVSRADTMIHP